MRPSCASDFAAISGTAVKFIREMLEIIDSGCWISRADCALVASYALQRSEEHTSELPSIMRISYAVVCLNTTNSSYLRYIRVDSRHRRRQHSLPRTTRT